MQTEIYKQKQIAYSLTHIYKYIYTHIQTYIYYTNRNTGKYRDSKAERTKVSSYNFLIVSLQRKQ